jgi:carboxypeptidase PM20D1
MTVNADTVSERLAQSLRFVTLSGADPGVFKAFHAFLAGSFPRVFGQLTVVLSPSDVSQAICLEWPGRDPTLPPILFLAHQDVVPVESETETAWDCPPFEGRIANGFVYGRGAMDDKGCLITLLTAAETLLSEGFQPERTIYFGFGDNEEIGGDGALRIAEALRAKGVHLSFVMDEGLAVTQGYLPGFQIPVALIGIAEKGSALVEITARAEGGHASMPPRPTASGLLAEAISAMESHPMPASLNGPTRSMLEFLAPEAHFPLKMVFANLWFFSPLVKANLARKPATDATTRTTMAVVKLESGVKENVVPAEARAVLNYRIQPGDTVGDVVRHVRSVVDTSRIAVTLLPDSREPSPVSSPETASFKLVAGVIRKVFPEAVVAPALVLGGTDSRHFSDMADAVYRFLPLRFLPGDTARIHGTNERVSVNNVAEMVRFYYGLISAVSASQ